MASWREHFNAWHTISKTNLNPIEEDGWILAGRDAEDLLRTIVNENYSFKGCHSFAAKRIPDPRNKRRREIDLIVVTAKNLYVIECKNWAGTLEIKGRQWVQTNSRGKVTAHEDVLDLNAFKMRLLVDYLHDQGIWVQKHQVCQKLIFMNSNLEITDSTISKNPDVVTPNLLQEYLGQQNNKLKPHEKLFASVIGLLLDEELKGKVLDGLSIERVGGEHHERLIQEISTLATWDKIFLHGTKILSGDIINRDISNIYRYPQRVPINQAKEVQVSFVKSKWLGLAKAFLKFGRPIGLDLYDSQGKLIAKTNGNPVGILRIMEAGSTEPTSVNICEVDRLAFGKHIAVTNQKNAPKQWFKFWGFFILSSILFSIPSVRDHLLTNPTTWPKSIKSWWQSLTVTSSAVTVNHYKGNYDFGRYAVRVYSENNQLFAETAEGKAKLQQTNTKNGDEFTVISSNKGNLGKYQFVKNQQGQIQHLIWIQSNGRQRKCPKV
jgi:Nuclease-related domain